MGNGDGDERTLTAERPPAEPDRNRRLPEFFIVGHAKCGTTAMYEMLRRHPQICMPEYHGGAGKEPWYFARDNPNPQTTDERSIEWTGRTMTETLDVYLSLFAHAQPGQRIGEASTSYLWSPTAAERIAAVQPQARIVAIIREPASFLRSLHLQLLENHHESEKSFRKAVALDEDRRQGRNIPRRSYWPRALLYSDRVRYVEQLSRFHSVFPREQVHVIIYDDFRADNEAAVRGVLRFLDVDDTVPVEAIDVNPTIGVRSVKLDSFRKDLRAGRGPLLKAARDAGKRLTSERLRRATYYRTMKRAVYTDAPPPDEDFMLELRHRFKDEVVALGEYLDRDLVSLWGYDKLG